VPTSVRTVEYFRTTVQSTPCSGFEIFTLLATEQVRLVAANIVPMGPDMSQMMLFPENPDDLVAAADRTGLRLLGPQRALLVQGADEMGAVAAIHNRLCDAGVAVYAANGVTDGRGGYGYLIFVRPQELAAAQRALGL